MRRPGRARESECERIDSRDRAVIQNPIAGGDMRPGIAIPEHGRREGPERERGEREDERRSFEGGRRGARLGGRGGGERGGERHRRMIAELR